MAILFFFAYRYSKHALTKYCVDKWFTLWIIRGCRDVVVENEARDGSRKHFAKIKVLDSLSVAVLGFDYFLISSPRSSFTRLPEVPKPRGAVMFNLST